MWAQMREDVITHFLEPSRQAIDIETYMTEVEDKYVTDAYHSLSIEGYGVTRELIELVRLVTGFIWSKCYGWHH